MILNLTANKKITFLLFICIILHGSFAISQESTMPQQNSDELKSKGIDSLKNSDWNESIDFLTNAISLNQNDPDLFFYRGIALINIDEHLEAIKDFESALNVDQNYLIAYFGRATANVHLRDYVDAIDDYTKFLNNVAKPEHFEFLEKAFLNRAICFERTGRTEQAIKDYEVAIELNPDKQSYRDRLSDIKNERKKSFFNKLIYAVVFFILGFMGTLVFQVAATEGLLGEKRDQKISPLLAGLITVFVCLLMLVLMLTLGFSYIPNVIISLVLGAFLSGILMLVASKKYGSANFRIKDELSNLLKRFGK